MATSSSSERPLWGDELALQAYELAQRMDPNAMGVDARNLQAELIRVGFTIPGNSNVVVDSALNRAQHLFKRFSAGHWQWLASGTVADPAMGESGVELAARSWEVAQSLDDQRNGLHYHVILGGLWKAGYAAKGPNQGATLRKALDRATDRFEKIGRGIYRWRPA